MKLPTDVRTSLQRRFDKRHRDWFAAQDAGAEWPMTIPLGVPTEQAARGRLDAALAWVRTWQSWQGPGALQWTERQWRTLGTQRVPELLRLDGPRDVAAWLDEATRWDRARTRQADMQRRWPVLAGRLGRLFDVCADYSDPDFERLTATLAWLERHPESGLYLRQLPIPGLDTKWIETRTSVLADLLGLVTGRTDRPGDFHAMCGLRRAPPRLRMRVLDPMLRARVGGLGDLTVPLEELTHLSLAPVHVVIVENLQTGLALGDLPGTVAFMALGYGVELLASLDWIRAAHCIYWGDIDTHGLAILSHLRARLPTVRSLFMDESTLLAHQPLWTSEANQYTAQELPHLLPAELALYRALKLHTLGPAVRLEQERIAWDIAWRALVDALAASDSSAHES